MNQNTNMKTATEFSFVWNSNGNANTTQLANRHTCMFTCNHHHYSLYIFILRTHTHRNRNTERKPANGQIMATYMTPYNVIFFYTPPPSRQNLWNTMGNHCVEFWKFQRERKKFLPKTVNLEIQ